MTKTDIQNPIHESVREHYAERARSASSCCEPETNFYKLEEIVDMPDEISGFSLGCGNAVAPAALKPGERVVDLGSGGGLESFLAARQVGPDGRVIGVDMTDEMLAKARANAEKLGLTNVTFRKGYIEALPLADAEVDVVISNCVINLSPDKSAVLAEIWRVLRPGGRLSISDIVSQGEIPAEFQADMALWSECASGALPVDRWERELNALGFESISIQPNDEANTWLEKIPAGAPFSAIITAVKPG